jgi:hypothetical protein
MIRLIISFQTIKTYMNSNHLCNFPAVTPLTLCNGPFRCRPSGNETFLFIFPGPVVWNTGRKNNHTEWSNSHATCSYDPWPMTCLSENNYIEIRKKNRRYVKCWKCPLRSAMRVFTVFLMFHATRRRFFAVTWNGSADEILLCLAQENREMYP